MSLVQTRCAAIPILCQSLKLQLVCALQHRYVYAVFNYCPDCFWHYMASVSQIEEMTRGQGQVVPSQEIQVVQSLEGGILADLLVKEGDQVKKIKYCCALAMSSFLARTWCRGAVSGAKS